MDPISRGFAEVRSIFFGELVEVSKNTLNHSGGKDRLGEVRTQQPSGHTVMVPVLMAPVLMGLVITEGWCYGECSWISGDKVSESMFVSVKVISFFVCVLVFVSMC